MEFSCSYNASSLPIQLLLSLQKETPADRRCFWKESRAAVWGLEWRCECIKDIQFTHTFSFLSLSYTHTLTHFETFLLAGWCLSCRFPYSVSVSWGREKHRHISDMTGGLLKQRERGLVTGLVCVVYCFLSPGQCSSLTSCSLITYHSVVIELLGCGVQIRSQSAKAYWHTHLCVPVFPLSIYTSATRKDSFSSRLLLTM